MLRPAARPRVLLYLHRLNPVDPTGVQRYAIEISQALAAQADGELDVELCSGKVRGAPDHGLSVRTTHPRAPRKPLHACWTLLSRPRIERVVGTVDLFHALLPFAPIPSAAPAVVTVHDLLPLDHPEWYPTVMGKAFHRSVRHYAAAAKAIIVPSNVVAEAVQQTLGVPRERITVVYEGVDGVFAAPVNDAARSEVRSRFGIPPGPYVICIGSVSARKNLEVLFSALAEHQQRQGVPPTLVVVGGDGDHADEIRQDARDKGVTASVRFTGWVAMPDLCALLSGAAALVHPSLFEGFGLTPLEAMAAGVPVVASTAGAVPEVVGDAAVLVDPADPTAWSDAIERIVGDEPLRTALVAAGRRRAAELTWPEAARQTLAVYRRVLGTDTQSPST